MSGKFSSNFWSSDPGFCFETSPIKKMNKMSKIMTKVAHSFVTADKNLVFLCTAGLYPPRIINKIKLTLKMKKTQVMKFVCVYLRNTIMMMSMAFGSHILLKFEILIPAKTVNGYLFLMFS